MANICAVNSRIIRYFTPKNNSKFFSLSNFSLSVIMMQTLTEIVYFTVVSTNETLNATLDFIPLLQYIVGFRRYTGWKVFSSSTQSGCALWQISNTISQREYTHNILFSLRTKNPLLTLCSFGLRLY